MSKYKGLSTFDALLRKRAVNALERIASSLEKLYGKEGCEITAKPEPHRLRTYSFDVTVTEELIKYTDFLRARLIDEVTRAIDAELDKLREEEE